MNFGFFTRSGDSYQAYGHMILFVQLGEAHYSDPAHTWLVDVAPGPPVPMLPMPLTDDPENVMQNSTPSEFNRLTRGFAPNSGILPPSSDAVTVDQDQDQGTAPYSADQAQQVRDAHALWQVEYRPPGADAKYMIVYQFSEQEFTSLDYNVQHYAKMFKPFEDVFSDDVIAMRFVLAQDVDDVNSADHTNGVNGNGNGTATATTTTLPITKRSVQRLTLFRGIFKRRLGEKLLEKIECKSEEDRVAILRKYFEIDIADEDIAHIKDRDAAFEKKKKPLPKEVEDML